MFCQAIIDKSKFVREILDMIGKIIGVLITGGVGTIIAVMGWLIWKKEKLSLMHDYHVNKVSAENKTAFCRLSGIGLIVIGIGLNWVTDICCNTFRDRFCLQFSMFCCLLCSGISHVNYCWRKVQSLNSSFT